MRKTFTLLIVVLFSVMLLTVQTVTAKATNQIVVKEKTTLALADTDNMLANVPVMQNIEANLAAEKATDMKEEFIPATAIVHGMKNLATGTMLNGKWLSSANLTSASEAAIVTADVTVKEKTWLTWQTNYNAQVTTTVPVFKKTYFSSIFSGENDVTGSVETANFQWKTSSKVLRV